MVGIVYCGIGEAYNLTGDIKKAMEMIRASLLIACQTGDRGGQGRAYLHLSDSHIRLKEFSTAIQMLETALPNYKWLQDEIGQAAFLLQIGFSLAHIAMKADSESQERALSAARAQEAFQQVLLITDGEMQHDSIQSMKFQVYLELGKIRYLQGMTDEALEYLEKHLATVVEHGRNICAGCGKVRFEDMLSCSKCKVVRYCCKEHQRHNWKHDGFMSWHRLACPMLRRYRLCLRGHVSKEALRQELIDFLEELAKETDRDPTLRLVSCQSAIDRLVLTGMCNFS